MLVLSPLWFLGIYVGLVVVTPLAVRLHRAAGDVGLVSLLAAAVSVDVLRFGAHVPGIAMANLAIVWGFCHQLGFRWRTLTALPRRTAWGFALVGFAGLVVLTNLGVYPRSMVGVPGEAISNMGPPTVCILALALLQVGIVLLVRERMTAWLQRPRPQRFTTWAGTRSMTVYLWHFPAFAGGYALFVALGHHVPDHPSLAWWVERPLWALVPAAIVAPVVAGFRRFEVHQ
jgi:peptidoglycan/LPS O-acetylase OafA/YrhL